LKKDILEVVAMVSEMQAKGRKASLKQIIREYARGDDRLVESLYRNLHPSRYGHLLDFAK
jgi:hypothetical protein